jgi:hypothetical protein
LVAEGDAAEVDCLFFNEYFGHNRVDYDGHAQWFTSPDIYQYLGLDLFDLVGEKVYFEGKLGVALDFAFERENLQLLIGTAHVENSRRSELVFYVECAIFGLQTDMNVAEVELLLQKHTLSFSNLTLTLKLFVLSILYFEE